MARTYKTQMPGAPADPETNPDATPIAGMGDDDAMIEVGGREIPINDVVRSAYETAALSLDEWNALDGHERDELIAGKRREMATMFKSLGDTELPSQADVQRRAQAAVEARRASRQSIAGGAKAPEPALPHSSQLDPADIAAPVLCRDGWLVPTTQRALPANFK
jgi:hypothetical protein